MNASLSGKLHTPSTGTGWYVNCLNRPPVSAVVRWRLPRSSFNWSLGASRAKNAYLHASAHDLADGRGYSSPSASGASPAAASASASTLASASASVSTVAAATSADASSGELSLMSPMCVRAPRLGCPARDAQWAQAHCELCFRVIGAPPARERLYIPEEAGRGQGADVPVFMAFPGRF